MIVSAHDGYPRLLHSGADFIEVDIRRNSDGVIILAHDEPEPGRGYPTLDQALADNDGRAGLHLDLKEAGYEAELLGRVLQELPPERVVATPDFDESIRAIKQRFPEIRVSPLDFVAVDQRFIDRPYDRPIWVWTVNDKRRMRQLMKDPRIECIITDRPDLALKLR